MSNISANVLFHLTPRLSNLKGILENGFQSNFCGEYSLFSFDTKAMSENEEPRNLTAMVCFCDLPLSLLKKHVSFYGSYGIGLTKEWGLKQGIEPVIYSHPNGQRQNPFEQLMMNYDSRNLPHIRLIQAFVKRWKGIQRRRGQLHNVDFYNEREWRYVPTLPDGSPVQMVSEKWAEGERLKVERNILKPNPLKFGPDDIQYIIVKSDKQIMPIHKLLCRVYGANEKAIVEVTTAIMTVDCITQDS